MIIRRFNSDIQRVMKQRLCFVKNIKPNQTKTGEDYVEFQCEIPGQYMVDQFDELKELQESNEEQNLPPVNLKVSVFDVQQSNPEFEFNDDTRLIDAKISRVGRAFGNYYFNASSLTLSDGNVDENGEFTNVNVITGVVK